jgi:hypothetical protein
LQPFAIIICNQSDLKIKETEFNFAACSFKANDSVPNKSTADNDDFRFTSCVLSRNFGANRQTESDAKARSACADKSRNSRRRRGFAS